MNETGLRAPGAGFSLKSEKEKSKIFFNVRSVRSARGPENGTNHAAEDALRSADGSGAAGGR